MVQSHGSPWSLLVVQHHAELHLHAGHRSDRDSVPGLTARAGAKAPAHPWPRIRAQVDFLRPVRHAFSAPHSGGAVPLRACIARNAIGKATEH